MDIILEIIRHVTGMTWKITWGLILGFMVSAFIQAFISQEKVIDKLGDASVKSVSLASLFGAASSSCSYAAAAMSKSLFEKGAHIAPATAFLFAATNLVIEIGLVIWSLLGWRFVAAEFFGGVLLILVVAVLLKWLRPGRVFDSAREHLKSRADDDDDHGSGTLPLSKIASTEGIQAAAGFFVKDWRMVLKDIVIGLAIAGTLAAVVPAEWWEALFLADRRGGDGSFWITVENVFVGPVIAILSFVCSVGNIPLAAVLWDNGISFAGVIGFIFADLITIPMVLVYRRYYGWKPALIYSAYLLAAILVAALAVEVSFAVLGLVPESPRGGSGERTYFAWDYTTVLNMIFIPAGLAFAWRGLTDKGGS